MRQTMIAVMTAGVLVTGGAAPASAQLGSLAGRAMQAKKGVDTVKALVVTEQEEIAIGAAISAKLREKYGVVQNQAVHKYVALTGRVLADASARPTLPWTFVVLDTDGVNAFAAPGGYIHITRGALAIIRNESELAGVLAHEIIHVTEKHTLDAIKKSKGAETAISATTRSALLEQAAQIGYESVLENSFDRGDEDKSDQLGMRLANSSGYAPAGLGGFLATLAERNKDLKEPSGIFASHNLVRDRLDRMKRQIASEKLAATALVAARYTSTISYKPVPVTAVTTVAANAKPAETSGGSRLGLGGLKSALGGERSSSQTVSSAGSRGVNPDRDAKGGANSRAVSVTITAAELAAFRKGIAG